MDRASGEPGRWKTDNAEHYIITVHFRQEDKRLDQSIDLVLLDEEDEDDAYEEFLEEEVLN